MDIMIICVVIIAIIFRLVIMKGSFTLPTFYRNGNELSFNLGTVSTIIIAILAAIVMMYTAPEQFANPIVAFLTAYSAPQIVDGVVTFGTRQVAKKEEKAEDAMDDSDAA